MYKAFLISIVVISMSFCAWGQESTIDNKSSKWIFKVNTGIGVADETTILHNSYLYGDMWDIIDTTERTFYYLYGTFPIGVSVLYDFEHAKLGLNNTIEIVGVADFFIYQLSCAVEKVLYRRNNLDIGGKISFGMLKMFGGFAIDHFDQKKPFTASFGLLFEKEIKNQIEFYIEPSISYKYVEYMTMTHTAWSGMTYYSWTNKIISNYLNFGISKSIYK